MDIRIRLYQEKDKVHVQDICRKTASPYYQEDVDRLEAVTIMYNDYFTTYEKEHVLVAVDHRDIPIGYIMATTNFKQNKHIMKTFYYPKLEQVFGISSVTN